MGRFEPLYLLKDDRDEEFICSKLYNCMLTPHLFMNTVYLDRMDIQ